MPPGRYDTITILRNKKTGKAARAVSAVVIPENEDTFPLLSGPVLFVQGGDSPSIRLVIDPVEGRSKTKNLQLVAMAPRLGKTVSPLVLEMGKDTPSLFAVFGFKKEPASEITAQLLSQTTDESFSLKVLERKDIQPVQKNTVVFELIWPSVSPGEYTLEITINATESPENAVLTRNLLIR